MALPVPPASNTSAGAWDDEEEDLAVKEMANAEKLKNMHLAKKGNALKQKKEAEAAAKLEMEVARKAMEMEAEAEANMTEGERKALERKRVEDADMEATNDLFGGMSDGGVGKSSAGSGNAASAGDTVVIKDLKDGLKHAKKVGAALKKTGNAAVALAHIKELLNESKELFDEDMVGQIISVLNVIKNEKVQAAKRKVKGQANKSKKADKAKEARAKKIQKETFGDNDRYDDYDEYGAQYEDNFF